MNEPSTESGLVQSASEPEIQSRKRFSVIWLIPMIAALIGIWLAVKAHPRNRADNYHCFQVCRRSGRWKNGNQVQRCYRG